VGFDTPTGLLVQSVERDTFGAKLGLGAGDLLVELGGAALFGKRELLFFLRGHEPGEQVDAAWVRDGQLRRGRAELSPWQFVEWRALRADIGRGAGG
jgi:S1-C subfamily serine protease